MKAKSFNSSRSCSSNDDSSPRPHIEAMHLLNALQGEIWEKPEHTLKQED